MHGGKREGAGRKKGTRNRTTVEREETMKKMAVMLEGSIANVFMGDSHELLMAVYKNEDLPLALRIDAAKAAIGYEKPKLAAIEHSGEPERPVNSVVRIEIVSPDGKVTELDRV